MFISVIICTHNRCESLKDTLESLSVQEGGGDLDYEAIVVDNNSNDGTRKIVEEYADRFKGKLSYFFEPRQGKSYAMNSGVKKSRGSVLVFTDDDVVLDKGWLFHINKAADEFEWDAIGGRVLPLCEGVIPRWALDNVDILSGPLVAYDYGDGRKRFDPGTMLPFIGANMIARKESFDRFGSFRVDIGVPYSLGEDTEYFRRMEAAGARLFYGGDILAWHKLDTKRANLSYIARWYMKSGRYYAAKLEDQETLLRLFGVPRFLIRQVTQNFLSVALSIFNQRCFLKNWMNLFRTIGMISFFRKRHA